MTSCVLFFANDGTVTNESGDLVATSVADIDVSYIVDTFDDVQVTWPVHYGQPGKSYADEFLLRLDAARCLPLPEVRE